MSINSLLLGVVCLFLSACSVNDSNDVMHLTEGRINFSTSTTPPTADNADWQVVTLEDAWLHTHPGKYGYAWYELTLPLTNLPDQLMAIYIPHVNMNAEVWLNGEMFGTGGDMSGNISRNWNYPQYFLIPKSLLNTTKNTLHIRLVTLPHLGGVLSVIHLGPNDALRHVYIWQKHWQVTSAIGISALLFLASMIFGALWLYRRHDYFFLSATITSIVWLVNCLHFYVVDVPVSSSFVFRVEQILVLWTVVSFVITCSLYMSQRYVSTLFKYLVGFSVVVTSFMLFSAEDMVSIAAHITQIISALSAIWITVLIIKYALNTRMLVDVYLGISMILGTIFGIHDMFGLNGALDNGYYHIMQFAAIFPMTALGWIVVSRFSQAMSISENYNKELTAKVQEAHSELKSGFDKLRQYENEKVINSERERVMRDMHDGVGAHIVSTLAMVEVGNFDQHEISASLRDALNELRNIIDSLDPLANNVLSILASVRERFESRLNKANIELIWSLSEKDIYPDLSPDSALHFMRFLQEALTNVVKHAAATSICISTDDISGYLSITIQDNGSMMTNDKLTGRGLQNMRQRASYMNAGFSIENTGDGTVVKLDFKM